MTERAKRFFGEHRVFLGHWAMEFLVVLVGVLLALSVQEWAAKREASGRGDAATARIRAELKLDAVQLSHRLVVTPCLMRRVAHIAAAMRAPAPSARLDTYTLAGQSLVFPAVYLTPGTALSEDAFRSALAAGDLAALPAEHVRALTAVYRMIADIQRASDEESRVGVTLGPLQVALPRSGPERTEAWRALYVLEGLAVSLHDDAAEALGQIVREGGGLSSAEIAAERNGFWRRAAAYNPAYATCRDFAALDFARAQAVSR